MVRGIRARVLAGETLFGAWADLGSPLSAELVGKAGFDWVLVDLEHGAATEAELLAHLHAVEVSGAAALVRVQSGERLRIGRALDLGAEGIMVPRLETAEQAREVVSFLRYPPDGVRGVALRTRGAGLGRMSHAGVRDLNRDVLGIVQVESASLVREIDAVAAIDGVDVLFVGPTDLSHSLGVPGDLEALAFRNAIRGVVDACRAHGKAPGVLLYDPATFEPYLRMGFRFLGTGADGFFVDQGARTALATARAAQERAQS